MHWHWKEKGFMGAPCTVRKGFMGIYGKAEGDINPHKSQTGFIKNQYNQIKSP